MRYDRETSHKTGVLNGSTLVYITGYLSDHGGIVAATVTTTGRDDGHLPIWEREGETVEAWSRITDVA